MKDVSFFLLSVPFSFLENLYFSSSQPSNSQRCRHWQRWVFNVNVKLLILYTLFLSLEQNKRCVAVVPPCQDLFLLVKKQLRKKEWWEQPPINFMYDIPLNHFDGKGEFSLVFYRCSHRMTMEIITPVPLIAIPFVGNLKWCFWCWIIRSET